MSEPIALVSHLKVIDGKLEALREYNLEAFKVLEATKPGTVVHIGYANEDSTLVSFINVFPDAKSLDLHMEGVNDRANNAYEFLETVGYEIYGAPSERVMEMMKRLAGSGIPLEVEPEYMGGYMRLKSG